jgi:hypothetical protein
LGLAAEYFSADIIEARWQEILTFESQAVAELPIRAALH